MKNYRMTPEKSHPLLRVYHCRAVLSETPRFFPNMKGLKSGAIGCSPGHNSWRRLGMLLSSFIRVSARNASIPRTCQVSRRSVTAKRGLTAPGRDGTLQARAPAINTKTKSTRQIRSCIGWKRKQQLKSKAQHRRRKHKLGSRWRTL